MSQQCGFKPHSSATRYSQSLSKSVVSSISARVVVIIEITLVFNSTLASSTRYIEL